LKVVLAIAAAASPAGAIGKAMPISLFKLHHRFHDSIDVAQDEEQSGVRQPCLNGAPENRDTGPRIGEIASHGIY